MESILNSVLFHCKTAQNEWNPLIEWKDCDDSEIAIEFWIFVSDSAKRSENFQLRKMELEMELICIISA